MNADQKQVELRNAVEREAEQSLTEGWRWRHFEALDRLIEFVVMRTKAEYAEGVEGMAAQRELAAMLGDV